MLPGKRQLAVPAIAILVCVLAYLAAGSVSDFAIAASGKTASTDSQEAQLRTKLSDDDKLIKKLHSLLSDLGSSRDQPKDKRGKTLVDDLRQFVLTDDARSAIAASRQHFNDSLDRHDIAAALSANSELESQLRMETLQYLAITKYWSTLGSHPPDRQPYLLMLRENSIAPRRTEEIQAHEAKFDQQIAAGYFQDAMNNTYPALSRLYDQAFKDEFVDIRTLIHLGIYKPMRILEANAPCKPPASRTSGRPTPSMDSERASRSPADFYSDEIKRAGEEGPVMLSLTVTPEGCVAHSALIRSTGYPRLDDAALRYSLTIPLLPAERDGKAVESVVQLPINFALTEAESPSGNRPVMSPK